MMNRRNFILIGLTVLLLTLGWGYGQTLAQAGQRLPAATGAVASPVGAAFTYQGRLNDNGVAANGSYDFEFSLYDDLAAGVQVGSTVAQTIAVNGGVFTTSLDFGADAFDGEARYLEIAVQLSGGGGFTTLTPRQPITAVPYASYADKVQPVGNVVVVAKSGGDFTTLADALASITTASPTNPYLIKIAPGIYQEQVDLKSYVNIEGSGQGITVLQGLGGNTAPGTDGSSATLRANGIAQAEIRQLTVESDGTGNSFAVAIWTSSATVTFHLHDIAIDASGADTSYALFNDASSISISNVIANANNSTDSYGIYNDAGLPKMDNVTVKAFGNLAGYGIFNSSSPSIMHNINVTVSGATNSYGIYNDTSSPRMKNATVSAARGTNNYAIYNNASSPTLNNVTVDASSPLTGGYGVYNDSSSLPIIRNSALTGGTNSIGNFNSSSAQIANTMLVGSPIGAGTYTCFNTYDDSFAAVTCP
ncbi:MAG: pectinesterase family protein [Chloroflexota bacterium]